MKKIPPQMSVVTVVVATKTMAAVRMTKTMAATAESEKVREKQRRLSAMEKPKEAS